MLFLCCVYSLTSIRVKYINCLRIWCTLNHHKNASVWFLPRGHLPSASLSRALTPGWFSQFLQKGFSKNSNNPGVVNFHGLVELIKEIEYWLKNNIWRWILYWYGLEIAFHLIQETESQKFLHINTFFSVYIRCMYIVYILIQAWFKSGGDTTKPFRPELEDSYLPEEYAARSGMKKVKMLCM